uniref:Uncharacterized protein n=1 Tax=Taeniopygia guttata TaxID=59729 RepID=A0A674GLV1_TAEGU
VEEKLSPCWAGIARFSAAASLTSLHLLAVLRHVVRADGPQEFDVIIAVVLGHLLCIGLVRTTYIDLHLPVEPIVEQEVVGHADPVGFHGMSLAIIIIPNIPWKQKGVQRESSAPLGFISPPLPPSWHRDIHGFRFFFLLWTWIYFQEGKGDAKSANPTSRQVCCWN